MKPVLLDASIFLFALGAPHPLREPCIAVLRQGGEGALRLNTSVEAVQELVFHRLRLTGDRARSVGDGLAAMRMSTVLDLTVDVLELSLGLVDSHPRVRGRDAIHAATALAHGIDGIVSPDRAFDGIPGLTRIDPLEFA